MSTDNPDETAPVLPHQVYADALRAHAVTLIWLGYQRLNASSFAVAEEDDITGELVREMKLVAQDPSSPDWVDHYEIHEQDPQNVNSKRGKHRPKMDIEVECHRRGPRPRLGFEAKRLGRGNSVGDYLDDKGLGAFLTGYYPTTHGEAGMLGYVQEQTPEDWSVKLATSLNDNREKYRVATKGVWRSFNADVASSSFCTSHTDASSNPLFVIHVLLPFA